MKISYSKKKIYLILFSFVMFSLVLGSELFSTKSMNDYEIFSEKSIDEETIASEKLSALLLSASDDILEQNPKQAEKLDEKNNETAKEVFKEEIKEDEVEIFIPAETLKEELDSVYVKVVSVVDGDTIKVLVDNKVETVRIVGIDTPETVHPSKPVECFGLEASNHAKKLLTNTYVNLVTDDTQGETDKYGRRLAYVILEDGRDFGEEMIKGGYAYEYTYNLPYRHQTKYKSAQTLAKTNGVGLWAEDACENFAKDKTSRPSANNLNQNNFQSVNNTANSGCSIKGNISSGGEKIYHVLGQQFYEKTIIDESKGERWFCAESEAVEAGWRKSKV